MSDALRASLAPFVASVQPQHAGLWLDRFCPDLAEPEKVKPGHFDQACSAPEPPLYRLHYEVWKQALVDLGARLAEGLVGSQATGNEAPGRLVVGLGGESVLETSVTLHRTYGVPFIPGSALKGLAASYAHRRLEDVLWREGGMAHQAAFGTTEQAGCVVFYDALYIPGTGVDRRPLHQDVMTVHHPQYYRGEDSAPADWDSPIPVHFLTSTGKYLLAVSGPDLWSQKALEILGLALAEEGVGGKTSRGYGRMALKVLQWVPPSETVQAGAASQPGGQEFRSVERVRGAKPRDFKSGIQNFVGQWQKLPHGPEKKALARAILECVARHNWKDARSKPWYSEISSFLEE